MIHFWYSISISITDTFRVYQCHKSLIHDCDTFTGIQNSLLTRFAISVVNSSSRVSTTVSGIEILAMFSTNKSWRWRRFLWLRHNTINWLSSQCCRQGMYQLLEWHWHSTENAGKIGPIRKVFIKFNTTLPSSAPVKWLCSEWFDRSKCHVAGIWVTQCLRNFCYWKRNTVYFRTEGYWHCYLFFFT